MNRFRALAYGTPLWVRLVVIITALIATGLVIAGVLSATLLRQTLVNQVDEKLEAEGKAAAQATVNALTSGLSSAYVPTDYCVLVHIENASDARYTPQRVAREYGAPQLPSMSSDDAQATNGQPFTVHTGTGGSAWRAVAFPLSSGTGSVVVALPLGEIDHTTARMSLVLLVSGLGIVLLGGLAGGLAVRRSMRPLRAIERTAAAIAAGDLSQRVPAASPSTEVGRLGDALNGMLTQIEHAFDARTASEQRMRRFVADASHELRTPLATIRGYAELYRMGALNSTGAMDDTMGRIEGSATRMGGLVEDLLALARLDEGRPLELGAVDLVVVAGDASSDLQALDPERRVTLIGLDGGPITGPCWVHADESRVRQVVANLIGNVVRHTPAASPVELALGPTRDTSGRAVGVLEVRDHGPGIDPAHRTRVFERFYRVDASRTRDSGGAGLGMAIVASIVTAHTGSVDLLETPGGGATVRVALPIESGPGQSVAVGI